MRVIKMEISNSLRTEDKIPFPRRYPALFLSNQSKTHVVFSFSSPSSIIIFLYFHLFVCILYSLIWLIIIEHLLSALHTGSCFHEDDTVVGNISVNQQARRYVRYFKVFQRKKLGVMGVGREWAVWKDNYERTFWGSKIWPETWNSKRETPLLLVKENRNSKMQRLEGVTRGLEGGSICLPFRPTRLACIGLNQCASLVITQSGHATPLLNKQVNFLCRSPLTSHLEERIKTTGKASLLPSQCQVKDPYI